MFAIVATVLWIILDVAMFLLTTPMLPTWQWWGFLCAGFVLGVAALIGEIVDRKEHKKEITDLKTGQAQHSYEHDVLAGANIQILERLQSATNTTGAPIVTTIEIATEKIQSLQTEVANLSAMFWRSPNEIEAKQLEEALSEIGRHSVKFSTHENTDCSRFARNLMAIFTLADWRVSGLHTGIDDRLGATGILVRGKETLDLASKIADAIRTATNANCAALVTLGPEEPWDVAITIAPKGTVRSQPSRVARQD